MNVTQFCAVGNAAFQILPSSQRPSLGDAIAIEPRIVGVLAAAEGHKRLPWHQKTREYDRLTRRLKDLCGWKSSHPEFEDNRYYDEAHHALREALRY